jgi:hypothetical protein
MSQIHLYIDEDSQNQALVRALQARQVDILTVRDTDTYYRTTPSSNTATAGALQPQYSRLLPTPH